MIPPSRAATRLLVAVLADLGRPDSLGSTFAGGAAALAPALGAAAALKDLLADELVLIDDETVKLGIEADGRNVTVYLAASRPLRRVQRRHVPRLLGRRSGHGRA